jgi:hypothetical protein
MTSSSTTDVTAIMDTSFAGVNFPILKGDLCFSATSTWRDAELGFFALDVVEHQVRSLDVMVTTLDRVVARGSHRVVVFNPWPMSCNAIIVQKPNGERVVFDTDFLLRHAVEDSALLNRGVPVATWTSRLRERMSAQSACNCTQTGIWH